MFNGRHVGQFNLLIYHQIKLIILELIQNKDLGELEVGGESYGEDSSAILAILQYDLSYRKYDKLFKIYNY